MSQSFHEECKKRVGKAMYVEHVKKLVVEVGGGRLVESKEECDVVFTSVKEKKAMGSAGNSMTWNEFINCECFWG